MHTEFTPVASAIGGALIGLSAVLLMLLNGRVAGISGILGRLIMPSGRQDIAEAGAFVAGLLAAPAIGIMTGTPIELSVSGNLLMAVIAGLLVGFGAAYGSGCTSGHGVCGISRLSMRSLMATLTFMAVAIFTVYVSRHVLGMSP